MNVLFVAWAGGGNSTPVLGLATRLKARHHTVRVAGIGEGAARFAAAGIDYEPLDRVTETIARIRPDAVVVDFMMPSWMSEAEASGVPWVAYVHTLYDRVGVGILTAFTTLEQINAQRVTLGLDELATAPALLERATRVLVTAPRALDTDAPTNGAHVGAILEEPGADAGWSPPAGDDPLVVVSPGTTPGLNEEQIIERTLAALADLHVRAVVNVGAHIDVSAFRVPPNVVLSGYVRHAAVLPYAAAVVTHAGLGSIVAALAYGLPLVCLPLDRDQPHNAQRVAAVGAGIALTREASIEEIHAAITSVLADPQYRSAAQPFAVEYDASAQPAIGELEALR